MSWLRVIAGLFSRTVLALLLVASMSLTVLSLTVSGVQVALSGALSAAGMTTIAAREAAAAQTRRTAAKRVAQQTSERVTRRVTRAAARNSSSVVAEAVPFLGVAVIAGALAYDIKDACDTARDMAGLEAAASTDGDPQAAFDAAVAAFDCADLIPEVETLPDRATIWNAMSEAPQQAWESATRYYEGLPDWDPSVPLGWMQGKLGDLYGWISGGAPAGAE